MSTRISGVNYAPRPALEYVKEGASSGVRVAFADQAKFNLLYLVLRDEIEAHGSDAVSNTLANHLGHIVRLETREALLQAPPAFIRHLVANLDELGELIADTFDCDDVFRVIRANATTIQNRLCKPQGNVYQLAGWRR